jgi:RHS repeat-associated protein
MYHYHSDHLGSASFVTDREGAVCQHIQYLPFGELFVSQRNCEFDSRYKFTAKELDNETSYTYFGARYYDSDLSVWLSVDPMADERSWVSPYSYCQNNPVVLVDPRGMIDDWYMNEETGELYYNKNRSSQTTQYNNKTYTRIGDNNMFGDMGNTTEKSFNYDESISFANEHGYAIVPTQQLLNRNYYVYYVPTGNYTVRTEGGVETFINEKYDIINKDYSIKNKTVELLPFKNKFLNGLRGLLGNYEQTFRIYYEYKQSSNKEEYKNTNINDGYSRVYYSSWKDYESNSKRKNLLQYKNIN